MQNLKAGRGAGLLADHARLSESSGSSADSSPKATQKCKDQSQYYVKSLEKINETGLRPSHPLSAYCLFSQHRREQLRKQGVSTHKQSVTDQIKKEWRRMPDKGIYKTEAKQLYNEYRELFDIWAAKAGKPDSEKEEESKDSASEAQEGLGPAVPQKKEEQEVIQTTADSSDQKCEFKRQLRARTTKPDYVGKQEVEVQFQEEPQMRNCPKPKKQASVKTKTSSQGPAPERGPTSSMRLHNQERSDKLAGKDTAFLASGKPSLASQKGSQAQIDKGMKSQSAMDLRVQVPAMYEQKMGPSTPDQIPQPFQVSHPRILPSSAEQVGQPQPIQVNHQFGLQREVLCSPNPLQLQMAARPSYMFASRPTPVVNRFARLVSPLVHHQGSNLEQPQLALDRSQVNHSLPLHPLIARGTASAAAIRPIIPFASQSRPILVAPSQVRVLGAKTPSIIGSTAGMQSFEGQMPPLQRKRLE